MSDAPGRWPVDAGRIRRLLRLRGRQHVADEVESELAFHMQSRIDDLVAAGLTAGDAETQARREFGDLRAAREELIAMLAEEIRGRLGVDEDELPLASVLEGGTWWAGRRIAAEKRPGGGPPIRVVSDGTVF